MRFFLLLAINLCCSIFLFAQKKIEPWGTISTADLAMTAYDKDPTATALILQELGDTRVIPSLRDSWVVEHTVSRRIKIFDVSALEEGNLRIHYRSGSDEKISELSVQVFMPNGEVRKVKSENVFTEKLTKYWSAKKIFIPDLQKGCVIEYKYTLTSENIFSLYGWYFQDEAMPVRWSELHLAVPEYFTYVMVLKMSGTLDLYDVGKSFAETGHNGYVFNASPSVYGKADIPALKEEPYITTLDDYREQISFQLAKIQVPRLPTELIMTTWSDLAERLENDKDLGAKYRKPGNFKDLWEAFSPLISKDDTPAQIMEKARAFVSSSIKWDDKYGIYPKNDLDKAFELKTGNIADINLAVVALLRKAGLNAVPLMVSSADNGKILMEYPIASQFNAVVACVREGDKRTFIDATDPYLPVGQISAGLYNKLGWAIDHDNPEWVPMKSPDAAMTWLGNLRITEEGALKGNFDIVVAGPLAASWRNDLDQYQPAAFVKRHFAQQLAEITIDSFESIDQKNIAQPLHIKFNINVPGAVNIVNDYMYCSPVLDFVYTENPFKSPKRELPVTFPFPVKSNYTVMLELPKGYQLEDAPKPAKVSLMDGNAKVVFNVTNDAQNTALLHLNLRASITETEYAPENYEPLRTFFNLVYEKTSTQLVLKKS